MVTTTSRWYKCDLQVATPGWRFKLPGGSSYNFAKPADRARFADLYMERLKERGIEVIALADHHGARWLDEMRAAGTRHGITVFPGVEVTTGSGADGVHLILVGDLDKTVWDIEILLAKVCGFDDDHPRFRPGTDEPAPAKYTVTQILDELPDGWLAIAPHALTDNGIASGKTHKSDLKWKALHHDRLAAVDPGDPREANGNKDGHNARFRARALDDYPCLKRLAFVSTSDAYCLEDLGRRFTWIRMAEPSLEGLRQAFLDFEARIICDWDELLTHQPDPNIVGHAWIEKVTLSGRLGNSASPLSVTFDPRLNVIIGGRGSGKSTLVTAIRQLYGSTTTLPSGVKNETEQFIRAVFNEAQVEGTHHLSISGETQTARWDLESGSRTSHNGEDIPTSFPVRVIGQKELFERVVNDPKDPYAASRNLLALVDEALGLARATPTGAIGFWNAVTAAENKWIAAVADRQDLEASLATRPQLEARVAELQHKIEALDAPQERQRREHNEQLLRERADLDASTEDLACVITSLRSQVDELIPEQPADGSRPAASPGSLAAHQQALDGIRERLRANLHEAFGIAEKALAEVKIAYQEGEWAEQVRQAEADTAAYQQKLAELGVDPSMYAQLREDLRTATASLAELAARANQLDQKKTAEADAWSSLLQLHAQRRDKRNALLEQVAARSGSLRFEITPHRDAAAWAEDVRSLLNLRADAFVDDVPALARWLWEGNTDDLADRMATWRDALVANDYTALAKAVPAVRSAWWTKLRGLDRTIRARLAALIADDVVTMFFRRDQTPSGTDADWQPVSSGSPGQRSAAMLSFVLHHGTEPLVLDQPEDDLDTAWISTLIVRELRKSRWTRQIIVVTHNANIPVNGDAERVIVLHNTGDSIAVKTTPVIAEDGTRQDQPHVGPIEIRRVREDIQDIMEGGVDAFIARERRYNNELSTYRAALHGKTT